MNWLLNLLAHALIIFGQALELMFVTGFIVVICILVKDEIDKVNNKQEENK